MTKRWPNRSLFTPGDPKRTSFGLAHRKMEESIGKSLDRAKFLLSWFRPEPEPDTFANVGTIEGSIEKWNWVEEDPSLPGAPIGSTDRFVQKHWSR